MLEFVLTKCEAVSLPVGYFGLLDELWRETPICVIFSSKNRQAYKIMNEHLQNENNIFDNLVNIQLIQKELQIVLEVIKAIKDYEDQVVASDENFLSEPVVRIFKEMLKVKSRFEEKALELDGTKPPKPTKPAAFVEIYPTLLLQSEEEKHFAYRHKHPEHDKAPCNTDYP